jgi:hypothetical protein
MIKLRKPQAAIDLNLFAPVEEYPEFKVKVRKEKRKSKGAAEYGKEIKERERFG